jgi:hypothetical protein
MRRMAHTHTLEILVPLNPYHDLTQPDWSGPLNQTYNISTQYRDTFVVLWLKYCQNSIKDQSINQHSIPDVDASSNSSIPLILFLINISFLSLCFLLFKFYVSLTNVLIPTMAQTYIKYNLYLHY